MPLRFTKEYKIWSSDINYDEDWKQDMDCECPELSKEQKMDLAYEINGEDLDIIRDETDIQLSNPIIIIGDLGLWNGRKRGYKIIKSGNIKDCFYSDDEGIEWKVDKCGDLVATGYHHDGINYYLYRTYKDNLTERQKENFHEFIYKGELTRDHILKYTDRIGDQVAIALGYVA